MGLSSDVVVVTSREYQYEGFPVKNTFIHFGQVANAANHVQRFKTAPSSVSSIATCCDCEGTDVTCSQVSVSTSGSSTPVASLEDQASAALKPVPQWPLSQYRWMDDGTATFGFTLKRHNGVNWGLRVASISRESREALLVDCVLPGGAIDAWNRQVMGGPMKDKALLVGDLIEEVNSASDYEPMIAECKHVALAKFCVLRLKRDHMCTDGFAGVACDSKVITI